MEKMIAEDQLIGIFCNHVCNDNATGAIRAGYDRFLSLQNKRLKMAPVPDSLQTQRGYLQDLQNNLGADVDTHIISLWELALLIYTSVREKTDTSFTDHFVAWVRDSSILPEDFQYCQVALESEMLTGPQWGFILELALKFFFCREFDQCAELVNEGAKRLRQETRLNQDEEQLIDNVLLLLGCPFNSPQSLVAWRKTAATLVIDSRTIEQQFSHEGRDTFFAFLRHLCLIAAGDADDTVMRLVTLNSMAPIWRVAATASLLNPSATLSELCAAFDDICDVMKGRLGSYEWVVEMQHRIMGCTSVEDLVCAMPHMAQVADYPFVGPNTAFCATFFAAHFSDNISQPFQIRSSFHTTALWLKTMEARSTCVDRYVLQFDRNPATWRIACAYTAFCPISDPQRMSSLFDEGLSFVRDEELSVVDVVQVNKCFVDPKSIVQIKFREITIGKLLPRNIAISLFESFDSAMNEALKHFYLGVVEWYFETQQFSEAVLLGIEAGHISRIETFLEQQLNSEKAIHSPVLSQIGDCVNSAFVILGNAPGAIPTKVETMLRVCACVCDVKKYFQCEPLAPRALPAIAQAALEGITKSVTSSDVRLGDNFTLDLVAAGVQVLEAKTALLDDSSREQYCLQLLQALAFLDSDPRCNSLKQRALKNLSS